MTYLSWDESRPCVLQGGVFAIVNRDTWRTATAGHGHGEYRMNRLCSFRLAMIALIPVAAMSLGPGGALAQSPPAAPPAASTPAPSASPPATSPTPAPATTPAPAPAPSATPAT